MLKKERSAHYQISYSLLVKSYTSTISRSYHAIVGINNIAHTIFIDVWSLGVVTAE